MRTAMLLLMIGSILALVVSPAIYAIGALT